jgi:hypothetical protein
MLLHCGFLEQIIEALAEYLMPNSFLNLGGGSL